MIEPETVHLEVSNENAAAFFSRGVTGEVVMLNLLRFRAVADYSTAPALAPAVAISGREAYERYIAHTLPFLHASGGRILYAGSGGGYLIGPAGRGWDMALLVLQRSVESFMAFASDAGYLAGIGHRVAALRDSRILPLVDAALPAGR